MLIIAGKLLIGLSYLCRVDCPETYNLISFPKDKRPVVIFNTTAGTTSLCQGWPELFFANVPNSSNSKTADSDTVSTYQVSSVQLVTDKKLEAFNKA